MFLASIVLYVVVCLVVQSLMLKPWLRSARWWWVGVNVVGVALALAIAYGLVYVMVYGLGLDVLQNVTHSKIIITSAVVVFFLPLIGVEWWLLRGRLPLPLLWSILNPLALTLVGFVLLTTLAGQGLYTGWPGLALGAATVVGAIAGALTSSGIRQICGRLARP